MASKKFIMKLPLIPSKIYQKPYKFLVGGGDYPGVEIIGRYHAPGSLEGWIVLKTDDPKAIYQHAAEWAEFLNWETTPVFTDEEAGPIVAKVYS